MALRAAKDHGFKVDDSVFKFALAGFDEVTDTKTGRVGYRKLGELSSRPSELGSRFPASETEALTALGL